MVVLCLGSSRGCLAPRDRLGALLENAVHAGVDVSGVHGEYGYDEAPFDEGSRVAWESHTALFAAHLRRAPAVDVVVTSEAYGPELSRRLGLEHHSCDPSRAVIALSSTAVRRDVVGAWQHLGPGTRALLATRVVLLGAESTYTTTVSRSPATRLRSRGGDTAVRRTGPVLVCDTDAFATPFWERRYLGADRARLDPAVLGLGHLCLLTDHDGVPFTQDGTRDGEEDSERMSWEFAGRLVEHGRPWVVLSGRLEDGVDLAGRITDQVVGQRLTMSEPI